MLLAVDALKRKLLHNTVSGNIKVRHTRCQKEYPSVNQRKNLSRTVTTVEKRSPVGHSIPTLQRQRTGPAGTTDLVRGQAQRMHGIKKGGDPLTGLATIRGRRDLRMIATVDVLKAIARGTTASVVAAAPRTKGSLLRELLRNSCVNN